MVNKISNNLTNEIIFLITNVTPLILAIIVGKIEIVKLFLSHPKIDVNLPTVLIFFKQNFTLKFSIQFIIKKFNIISHLHSLHFELNIFI